MSEDATPRNNDTSEAGPGPGERLQAARIERGIAIEDLANQMHLSVGILQSLENNRFEDITAPIFVKGYLRSYARIVDLDEGEILDLYVSEYMESDPPIGSTSNSVAKPAHVRRRSGGRWRLWLILLLIAAVLGGWWYQRSLQTAETISLDAAGEPPMDVSEQMQPAPEANDSLASDAARRLEEMAPLPAEAVTAEASVATEETTPVETASPAPAPQVAETETVEAPAEEPSPVIEASPAESVPQSPEPENSANQLPLQLQVTADTWADIRDASGRKLVYDLLRAGRKLSLEGEAPLRLFFGNGRGVELSWKGRRINLEDKIRADNTVRITLE